MKNYGSPQAFLPQFIASPLAVIAQSNIGCLAGWLPFGISKAALHTKQCLVQCVACSDEAGQGSQ